jgi:PAS domain S-box-containing protein
VLGVAFGLRAPFLLYYPAIIVAALLAGLGPGIAATVMSAVFGAYFFHAQVVGMAGNGSGAVYLLLFSGIGTVLSLLGDLVRRHQGQRREFEKLVEGLEEMAVVVDRDYRYVIANRAFLERRGMTREQVIGRPVTEILNPGVFEAEVKEKLDECFRGKIVQYETSYQYPALGERDLLISYFPIEGPGGVERVACVMQDTTERKRAERSLKLFRTLIDQSNDAVELVDAETLRFLDFNEKTCKDLGYTREELLSLTVFDINPTVDEDQRTGALKKLGESGFVVQQSVHRRKDGSTFPVETSLALVQPEGKYVVAVSRDISDRKQAEDALRESEDRYRDLVEHSEDLLCTHDLEGRLLSVNPAPARILGYEAEEMLKIPMRELVAPEFREQFDVYLGKMKSLGADRGLLCVMTRGGERRIWEYNNTLRTEGVATPVVRGMAHDVTERKRAESALRRREEDYRRFVAQSSEGIFRQDLDAPLPIDLPEDELVHHILHDSHLAECNDAIARMYGFTSAGDLVGKRLTEMVVPDDPRNIELTREYIRSGFRVLERESHELDVHGNPKIFLNSMIGIVEKGQLVRTWGIQRDVTERVKIEEARRKAEEGLQASEERFRVALKDSPITVFNQDRDLRYTWIYNPHLFVQHEIIGKTDDEIIGPDHARRMKAIKQRVLDTGTGLREEVLVPHNGKKVSLDVTIEPLFDSDGNVIGITGAAMDIARLRELADGLQEAKEKLVREKSYLEGEIQSELGFEKIIGQSSTLREVLKQARIVAPTDSTVLLLGETGTGKELVARSVHALSVRHEESFIKLNCAAVPSGLLESELFGHERGAFTGAVNQKVGRLELADKGTLFLDEIGELPLELQPKLLRVLQDREFERLGGVRTLRIDARIISATNRDLKKDVADRKFREDLFYRLNVFPIELPPLRERRSDIPILVHHFVHKRAASMGKHIEKIPPETIRTLQNWNWPGNIRELENVIERMVILTKGSELAAPPAELDALQEVPDDSLTDMEREHIIRVLRETNGNLSGLDGAASRLGIKRTTLQSMLKRLDINVRDYRRGTGTFGPE